MPQFQESQIRGKAGSPPPGWSKHWGPLSREAALSMICGFKECLISLEELPAPSGASCSPHGSVPQLLPAAGILEAQTLSEECGVAPTLSVTMRRPFDNLSGACPRSLTDPFIYLGLFLPTLSCPKQPSQALWGHSLRPSPTPAPNFPMTWRPRYW